MATELFTRQREAVREAYARGIGGDPGALLTEELTIVPRPDNAPWPYTIVALTFGTGTVVSVDPEYLDFVRAAKLAKHYNAFDLRFLGEVVAEGARRGQATEASGPALAYALAEDPGSPEPPPGFRLERRDAEWMNANMATLPFENGLGRPGVAARDLRNRYAFVLEDERGEPAAIAGVVLSWGLMEIGVDVAREHRGKGFAPIVVGAATRAILDSGEVPFYGCAATNIRSQHTAVASGFATVCSSAFVSPAAGG